MVKFYNIANIIDPNYDQNDYLNDCDLDSLILNYLKSHHEINTGDILFTGSTYETRQYYGFIIIDKRDGIKWINSEQGIDLPFEKSQFKDYLSDNKVKYQELFDSLPNYFSELSGYDYDKDNVANKYHKYGLW